MYDIIGDIHGHYHELTVLLKKMGYQNDGNSWGHPDRKVIFVGDYIDRGPKSPETLNLVRNMVENNQAIALMGNHELNAILFNEKQDNGGYVRPHSLKNFKQHADTLLQFGDSEEGQKLYEEYIEWFKTLPLYFEDDNLRVVHATWHQESIASFRGFQDKLDNNPDLITNAGLKGHELYSITENLLKGIELPLPDGSHFPDEEGHIRDEMRIKWWKKPESTPVQEYGFGADLTEFDGKMASGLFDGTWHYKDDKPVFFGHYWLSGIPELQNEYVCCLDYSIGKKEKLAAYRYNGEKKLHQKNLIYVSHGVADANK